MNFLRNHNFVNMPYFFSGFQKTKTKTLIISKGIVLGELVGLQCVSAPSAFLFEKEFLFFNQGWPDLDGVMSDVKILAF